MDGSCVFRDVGATKAELLTILSNVAAIEEGRQLLEAEPFQVYNKLL